MTAQAAQPRQHFQIAAPLGQNIIGTGAKQLRRARRICPLRHDQSQAIRGLRILAQPSAQIGRAIAPQMVGNQHRIRAMAAGHGQSGFGVFRHQDFVIGAGEQPRQCQAACEQIIGDQ